MDLSDRNFYIIIVVILIIVSITCSFSIYREIQKNSYIDNSLYEFKICNSDNITKIDECREIWTVYYVEDGTLGYSWFNGGKILGQATIAQNIIFVEQTPADTVRYQPALDKYMTTLEHELEHMYCRCDWHG